MLRVKYFQNNIGVTIYLERIKEVLEHYDILDLSDINCIIELFNIHRYLDAETNAGKLNGDILVQFVREYRQIPCQIGRFCNTISKDTFDDIYSSVEGYYTEDFWELLDTYKAYNKIDAETLKAIPHRKECQIPPSVI